jgi:hypothetical protein
MYVFWGLLIMYVFNRFFTDIGLAIIMGVPPTWQMRECQTSPPKKTYSALSGAWALIIGY